MSNKCNTLFVFEGESTEGNITSKLEKYFMRESLAIKCAFCGDIYQFYRKLHPYPSGKTDRYFFPFLSFLNVRS